jgi:hypothetical protein
MSAVYFDRYCTWCSEEIIPTDFVVVSANNHREWLTALLHNWLPVKQASEDITTVILGFIYKPDPYVTHIFHKRCLDFTCHTTRSGRKTKMVRRLQDEEYVPGSGVAGCDSFDMGYNHGLHSDWEKRRYCDSEFRRPDDDDFVVGDKDEKSDEITEILSSDEGEWESDEEDSDEEDSDEEHDWD